MRAVINGQRFPDGEGKNAEKAKQKAARNALKSLNEKENLIVEVRWCMCLYMEHVSQICCSILNNDVISEKSVFLSDKEKRFKCATFSPEMQKNSV